MRAWLAGKLLDALVHCVVSHRRPDELIGGNERPYMMRWHLVRIYGWFNVYLHRVMRSDDERALHDHPWPNMSVVLDGFYDEVMPDFDRAPFPGALIAEIPTRKVRRRAGAVVFRSATDVHALVLPIEGGGIKYCWTLFITGPKTREWGFHCRRGWVHQRDYSRDGGCAE